MSALLSKRLKNTEWGEFNLESLFGKSTRGKRLKSADRISGQLPFVTAGETDEGISAFIGNDVTIFSANTVTIDMFGSAKYRSYKYGADDHVAVVHTENLSESASIFIAAAIHKSSYTDKFHYGRNFYAKDADELNIKLPIKDGKVDFKFMENFISELEAERISDLEAYLSVTGLRDYTLKTEEKSVLEDFTSAMIWQDFTLDSLFEIATGRDVIIGSVSDGCIPLISHQHSNNGISKKISKLPNRRLFSYKKVLPLADRGVFLATTQNEDFHIGTRVKALSFKDDEKSLATRLFFVSSINKLQVLFSDYSENATDSLPKLKISLPVENKRIDYKRMETFISAIQKLVIKDVVLYADRKIAAHKEVVGSCEYADNEM